MVNPTISTRLLPAGNVRKGDIFRGCAVERVVKHRHWQLCGSVTILTAELSLLIGKNELVEVIPVEATRG